MQGMTWGQEQLARQDLATRQTHNERLADNTLTLNALRGSVEKLDTTLARLVAFLETVYASEHPGTTEQ